MEVSSMDITTIPRRRAEASTFGLMEINTSVIGKTILSLV
jgi:hypothetical protein